MTDDTPAKVYSDQRGLPIYLGDSGDGFTLPLKEKWRAPDAFAAVTGAGCVSLVVCGIKSMSATIQVPPLFSTAKG